jgi:hypothetical protein
MNEAHGSPSASIELPDVIATSEYTFTRSLVEADALDANTWIVVDHLEGDFPGNVVDLRYRFVLSDGLISELVIAP